MQICVLEYHGSLRDDRQQISSAGLRWRWPQERQEDWVEMMDQEKVRHREHTVAVEEVGKEVVEKKATLQ